MIKLINTRQKGFSLVETLIVIGIVSILVTISIPIFSSQLEKARDATDASTERITRALANSLYLSQADRYGNPLIYGDCGDGSKEDALYFLDVEKSVLETERASAPYGKRVVSPDNIESILAVEICSEGTFDVYWSTAGYGVGTGG